MATYSLRRAFNGVGASGAYQAGSARATPPLPSRALHLGQFGAIAKSAARSTRQLLRNAMLRRRWLRSRPAAIESYFAGHATRKLHLGCGPVVLPGWLNADVWPRHPEHVFVDVLEALPFADASLDYIFTEHLIGDLTYGQAATMLAECHRVLRPGGKLRIATPSLARLAELYSPYTTGVHRRYVEWAVDEFVEWADAPLPGLVVNNLFQEHRFVYDPWTLRHRLARAGFTGITDVEYGCSTDPQLRGIDSHGRVISHPELGAYESLTLEAVRP